MHDFDEAFNQLNTEQKAAVEAIDGPLLVIAGPGTGKTQLLALRTAHILRSTDTNPQNILCLTFTDVGARNMRDRLQRYIGQAAYDVRIGTYHAFGSDLIRSNPDFFDEFVGHRPIDALGQHQVMQTVYATIPSTNPLWREQVYLKDMLSFVSEAKRADLSPDDIRDIATANLEFIDAVSPSIGDALDSFARMSKSSIPSFEAVLEILLDHQLPMPNPEKAQPLWAQSTLNLQQALAAASAENGKTTELTAWKNDWLERDEHNRFVFGGTKQAKRLMAAADIFEAYLAALRSAGLFDYDDMILAAIARIKLSSELRYQLQERYQYIMLDEFQDTNPSQLDLIKLLTDNPLLGGRANIMAVGDDDQAIYAFQGADYRNMVQFAKNYTGTRVIHLRENWRSHKDIVDVSAAISQQIVERLSVELQLPAKELVAVNPKLPKHSIIERRHFVGDPAQAAWIADKIKQLIAKGTEPRQIAVIAPQHKYLENIVPFLRLSSIPLRYEKRENILDDSHVSRLYAEAQLIIALSVNDQAAADTWWPEILSAPHWQLSTSTIWDLSWQSYANRRSTDQPAHWTPLMLQKPETRQVALFYIRLSQIMANETLECMLDYMSGVAELELGEADEPVFRSPYFDFHFGPNARHRDPDSFLEHLSNLAVLRSHLRDFHQNDDGPLRLNSLITLFEIYRSTGEKLLNTSPYHSEANAVQLLTAYGAKGLEFDHVFVVDLCEEAWGAKARGASSNLTLPKNLQYIRVAGKSNDERARLLYVALSRSRYALYLTSSGAHYNGSVTSRLRFLQETTDEQPNISPFLPQNRQQIIEDDSSIPALEVLSTHWYARHTAVQQTDALREILIEKVRHLQLSATHINSFTDLQYGGPEQFLLNTVLRFPKCPSADGEYGNAMHETIDWLHRRLRHDGTLPTVKAAQDTFASRLRSKTLSDVEFARRIEKGREALGVFVAAWAENFRADYEHEVQFRYEGCFVGAAHLNGAIDQLRVDQKAKTVEVVDFKTGEAFTKWESSPKLHKYRQQLLFYKLLVESSHSYRDYTVTSGKLVFVEPDEHGQIVELPIEYRDADLEHVRKLTGAIWHCIQNLDFPDISEFDASIGGIKAFESWLIDQYSSRTAS